MTAHGRVGRRVVIGVGNEFRRDDGVGPAVIERLRGQVPAEVELVISDGDPVRLMEALSNASLAVVVDAVRAHPPQPGRRHRFVVGRDHRAPGGDRAPSGDRAPGGDRVARGMDEGATRDRAPTVASTQVASTHGLGLDAALGLAQALDRMPDRLIVHAIEAAELSHGVGMTPRVTAAVSEAAAAVRRDIMSAP